MKLLLVCIIILGLNNEIKQQPLEVVYTREIEQISNEQTVYNAYLNIAICLKANNRISISEEQFARYCTIMGFCESNLNTQSESNGQQGIPQLTRNTRRLLGIPDILNCSIEEQVWHHYKFFMACPNLRFIKSLEDLHMTNFKPYGVRKSRANGSKLDFNKDGWINKIDMMLFHKTKIKENKIIKQMYYEI